MSDDSTTEKTTEETTAATEATEETTNTTEAASTDTSATEEQSPLQTIAADLKEKLTAIKAKIAEFNTAAATLGDEVEEVTDKLQEDGTLDEVASIAGTALTLSGNATAAAAATAVPQAIKLIKQMIDDGKATEAAETIKGWVDDLFGISSDTDSTDTNSTTGTAATDE